MYPLIEFIKDTGALSLDILWFPLLIWTICCALAFMGLKFKENLNPLFHYHLRTAALLSLPLGIGVAALMSRIPIWFSASSLDTAFFVVSSPIEIVPGGRTASNEFMNYNWLEPSFLIGTLTFIVGVISLFMIIKLGLHYVALRSLHKNLDLKELSTLQQYLNRSEKSSVKYAFHDHPLVPFTFGWKQPVIVLPKLLEHEPEKLEMALQHELIHIQRGDYLLQLALSMIESLFWFHPLIRYGNQEIDTYREISCDQEVLSKSDFSIKSYANLLYELVPLSTGVGKLSVSMAVKNSTLKKRIKTMKYHKLHKASFRQSLFFLFLMILGITLPIACSDLRGPESVSMEELENTSFKLQNIELSVNGKIVSSFPNGSGLEGPGMSATYINANEYGVFKISPVRFEGATKAGTIASNEINFRINEMDVKIKSSVPVLGKIDNVNAWVQHSPSVTTGFSHSITAANQPMQDYLSNNSGINSKKNSKKDHFVVVEQMPKLKGGIDALEAKMVYPEQARRAGIEGKVVLEFIVTEDGQVEDPKVIRGIGAGADEEALRVIKEATFEPGIQRDQPVRVQYYLSVNFDLEDSEFSSSSDLNN